MSGFLKRYGKDAFANGFDVIPIKPGEKFPPIAKWQTLKVHVGLIPGWLNKYPDAGLGVRTKNTPAVDIDCSHPRIVDLMVEKCDEIAGDATIERIGRAPRILLVYRTSKPFKKVQSARYKDTNGEPQCVEILGDGQQFVALAVHPGTGKAYDWPSISSVADIKVEDLPEIDAEKARAICDYFESIVPPEWVKERDGNNGRTSDGDLEIDSANDLSGIAAKIGYELETIRDSLERLDNDDVDYDTWLNVGMAVHHETDGYEEGFDIWDEWSQKSSKYTGEKYSRERWVSFGKRRSGEPVTFRTVVAMLKGQGESAPVYSRDLDGFLRQYVHVEVGNRVADLHRTPNICMCDLSEFRTSKQNVEHVVSYSTPSKPDDMLEKTVPVAGSWLSHVDRKSARDTTYHPERPFYFHETGVGYVNLFYMPEHHRNGGSTKRFYEHMCYLFPIKVEREWFLDWMAFSIQEPGKRCLVTPLHISPLHGTGRGTVIRIIELLLGVHNCSRANAIDALASGFNEFLDQTLFCAVDEVRDTEDRYGIMNSIRDVLTEERLSVNVKYGAKGTQRIFTNFLMLSNHTDALILTAEDRRINVFEGPTEVKPEDYFDRLNAWISEANIAELFFELKERDLSSFNWKVSFQTPARERMIEFTQSDTVSLLADMVANPPYEAMTYKAIWNYLQEKMGVVGTDLNEKDVRKYLRQNCKPSVTKHRIGATSTRYWSLSKRAIKGRILESILLGVAREAESKFVGN